jgi:chitinase
MLTGNLNYKMSRRIFLILTITIFFYADAGAQARKGNFRVVGYVKGDLKELAPTIDYTRISHLNIAFINPDSVGVFTEVPGLRSVVSKAHQSGVKVLMAIAGGRAPEYYRSLISADRRSQFIANLSKFMNDHQLDGIDVDIEGELVTADYEDFVTQLALAVKPLKLLTAAVATVYGPQFTTAALAQFDFINIMSYDKTGPWRPGDAGQHAPYEMAVSDLDYWSNERKIEPERLNLGVPFYGYSFGTSGAGSQTYNRIITNYPNAQDNDEVTTADGGKLYYNGIPTIRLKTRLALGRSGGIMIWQLFQDASNGNSLLKLINDEIRCSAKKN